MARATRSSSTLPTGPAASLGPLLERLVVATPVAERLAADPVGFVHRFREPADQEVAALVAGTLAYGRVAAFRPVLEQLFTLADAAGGPAAWVRDFDPARHGPDLAPLIYRWNRGTDWVLLLAGLRRLYAEVSSLEALLPTEEPLPEALDSLVVRIRAAVVAEASACGVRASTFEELPRGLRYFLPRPAQGSATKRWWMILRWLVRRPTQGVDLGLWRTRMPRELLIPLDTHVLRIGRFLGLTSRKDGSLRTAREVTDALRTIDPDDPVRFDFAIAHLGISGSCRGHRDAGVCPTCPLDRVCRAA